METIFTDGSISIKRREGRGECHRGHHLKRAAYVVERNGVFEATLGPDCKVNVEVAAVLGTIDDVLGPQSLTDFLTQPEPKEVREYERFPTKPTNRREILEAVLQMGPDQYLRVPRDVEIVPADVLNFRKKGRFVDVRLPHSLRAIDAQRLTPAEAAMETIAELPLGVYAGLSYMGRQLRTKRIFSLVSASQGKRMYHALQNGMFPAKLEAEDYGNEVVFKISSFTDGGTLYTGRVGKLPVQSGKEYSQAFELTAQCSCEDNVYSTLPRSDLNSGGQHYANRPIRVGKHESAVLEALAVEKPDLLVNPLPFSPSPQLMELQWKLANRVLKGSRVLSGIEQEIELWGAVNKAYLGPESLRAA